MLGVAPGHIIGGPLTQRTFTFNPELPAYNILNTRIGVLSGGWDIAFFINNGTDAQAFLALDQERGTLARGRLSDQPAATRRYQHARQLLKRPASPEGPEWSAVTRPGARRLSGAFWSLMGKPLCHTHATTLIGVTSRNGTRRTWRHWAGSEAEDVPLLTPPSSHEATRASLGAPKGFCVHAKRSAQPRGFWTPTIHPSPRVLKQYSPTIQGI